MQNMIKKIHIADTPLSDIQTQEEIIPPICEMDICAMQRDNNITHDTDMLDDDVFHAPEITNSQVLNLQLNQTIMLMEVKHSMVTYHM